MPQASSLSYLRARAWPPPEDPPDDPRERSPPPLRGDEDSTRRSGGGDGRGVSARGDERCTPPY
ncbi:MAG TPA: hypothetical protein VHB78_12605, partial [Vicinamibacterales bacterium]|nr:hypothetical protein [Vicinamibacterales bacterium]